SSTSGPTKQYGPISTPSPICAPSATRAVASIAAILFLGQISTELGFRRSVYHRPSGEGVFRMMEQGNDCGAWKAQTLLTVSFRLAHIRPAFLEACAVDLAGWRPTRAVSALRPDRQAAAADVSERRPKRGRYRQARQTRRGGLRALVVSTQNPPVAAGFSHRSRTKRCPRVWNFKPGPGGPGIRRESSPAPD